MITHSMQQAATLGDRIVMMNQGRVLADYGGAQRRRIRAEDLVRRFDQIRRDEQLDLSAAEVLRESTSSKYKKNLSLLCYCEPSARSRYNQQ